MAEQSNRNTTGIRKSGHVRKACVNDAPTILFPCQLSSTIGQVSR